MQVKESWDAEDEEEVEEGKKKVKLDSQVQPVGGKVTPTRTASQGGEEGKGEGEGEEEEEEGSSEEESSESESEEELTPYEKAERRILVRSLYTSTGSLSATVCLKILFHFFTTLFCTIYRIRVEGRVE